MNVAALPTHFWFHATAHATFLINRMPSVVLEHQSPYYQLFHHEHDIKHLKVCGTTVYISLSQTL